MAQGKYKVRCGKLSYRTEQGAWEHVIHFKRQGYPYQSPYLCQCGWWHLTRKHFTGKVPSWVKEYAGRPAKKRRGPCEKTLPLAEQKKLYAQLNNKPASLWLRIKNFFS